MYNKDKKCKMTKKLLTRLYTAQVEYIAKHFGYSVLVKLAKNYTNDEIGTTIYDHGFIFTYLSDNNEIKHYFIEDNEEEKTKKKNKLIYKLKKKA
jgi:hypothetical protein